MSAPLSIEVRNAVRVIFANTDAEIGAAILADRLHRGTALCVLKQFSLEVEKIDPAFSQELVAIHSEAAALPQSGYGG
jgi:hypothetical protein